LFITAQNRPWEIFHSLLLRGFQRSGLEDLTARNHQTFKPFAAAPKNIFAAACAELFRTP
jgi:hypothetical protein